MRKSLALILVLALAFALMIPSAAFARGNGNGNGYAWGAGRHTNGAAVRMGLEARFERGVNRGQTAKLTAMVNSANIKIESLVKLCQITPWNDVDWLLKKVDGIVDEVMSFAARIGATVECTYTEYYVDGQYVLIDPLRVVDVGAGTRPRG